MNSNLLELLHSILVNYRLDKLQNKIIQSSLYDPLYASNKKQSKFLFHNLLNFKYILHKKL